MYPRRASLPAIVTLARAGSLVLAERLFDEGGFGARTQDPAALAVLGRLRKDRAALLPPGERAAGYVHAAEAYAAADALAPQPYTRLNVATLRFLAGDRAAACALARDIIAWLDGDADIADTPYYLKATRAESLLLCGDVAGAAAGLAEAVAAQPEAWEDHAVTLRQFGAICAAADIDPAFLDAHRPPRSLHFAGHLGIAAADDAALSAAVAAIVRERRVGFGFGALAAGADLVIAEALLDAGAELHVFLPGSVAEFTALSVDPYGAAWRSRFDACLDAAVEVRCFAQPRGRYQPLGSRVASDVAMGAALMNAHRLETSAVQLLIVDEGAGEYGSGLETARSGALWRSRAQASAGCQHVLRAARTAPVAASGTRRDPEGDPDLRLATLLHIALDGIDELDEAGFAAAVHERLLPLRQGMAALSIQPDLSLPAGNARIAAFAEPAQAWRYARAVLDLTGLEPGDMPLRIAGHHGLAHWLGDPPALVGRALGDLARIAAAALPGVLTVSETLAHVLQLAPEGPPRVEHVGEAGEIALFTVTQEACR